MPIVHSPLRSAVRPTKLGPSAGLLWPLLTSRSAGRPNSAMPASPFQAQATSPGRTNRRIYAASPWSQDQWSARPSAAPRIRFLFVDSTRSAYASRRTPCASLRSLPHISQAPDNYNYRELENLDGGVSNVGSTETGCLCAAGDVRITRPEPSPYGGGPWGSRRRWGAAARGCLPPVRVRPRDERRRRPGSCGRYRPGHWERQREG